jgi:PPOX class probable F420-dependent enzyme
VTPAEARERFAGARVARLATADARGRPHLVPVVFAVDGDRIYSVVDAKPKRTTALRRLRNVAENPFVALLVDHYDDADWAALWWVRAEGRGRVLEVDAPEARRAVELLRARYPQQQVVGAVLAVDVERWSGWSAT